MISIIYLVFIIVLCVKYGEKIKELENRIKELEFFLLNYEECVENEVDDE